MTPEEKREATINLLSQLRELLEADDITVDEAETTLKKTLDLQPEPPTPPEVPKVPVGEVKKLPKNFCVDINGDHDNQERVTIRIPLKLMKLGISIPESMPGDVGSHLASAGLNLGAMGSLSDEEFYDAFAGLSIDISEGTGGETVHIYCQ